MPSKFDPKRYSLAIRTSYVDTWETVRAKVDAGEVATIDVGTEKNHALSELFSFNKVRAAIRAQMEDGYRYDHIKLTLRDKDKGWVLVFEEFPNPEFKVE